MLIIGMCRRRKAPFLGLWTRLWARAQGRQDQGRVCLMVAIPSFMIRMRRDRRHLRGGVGSERARTRGIGREVLVFAKVDILGTESMVLATEKGDTTENPVNT